MNQRYLVAIAIVVVPLVCPSLVTGHAAKDVVDRVWDYMGGKENFAKARYVSFTWAFEQEGTIVVSRHHTWDRYKGDYVLEMKDRESGDDLKAYFNVETRKGVAYRNGTALEDATEVIERAYRVFINDTYWLLAHTKLEDYGTRLSFFTHEPSETFGGLLVLHLAFDDVGLTPGDEYWFYSTPQGQVVKWRYKLEGGNEGEFLWQEEKDCGLGLRFCTRKATADGKKAVVFPQIEFTASMDPAVFRPPANQ
ncbi:MAG: hypothetical protein ACE5EO_07705 [Candidatus Krumholzibacteriia bacterium]